MSIRDLLHDSILGTLEYAPGSNLLTVKLYHGGMLIWSPSTEYIGGFNIIYDYWRVEDLSLESITLNIRALGYEGNVATYYRIPGAPMEGGLMFLMHDADIPQMVISAQNNNNSIEIYVKHPGWTLDGREEISLKGHDEEVLFDIEVCGQKCPEVKPECADFDDSEYNMKEEEEVEFSKNDDAAAEWARRVTRNLGFKGNDGDDTEFDDESDGLKSMVAGEIEETLQAKKKNIKWPVYVESDDPKFCVGMLFTDMEQFREAVITRCIKWGKNIKFKKCEKNRVRAECKPQCPWSLYAVVNANKSLVVKSHNKDHTCGRSTSQLPLLHSGYLAKRYEGEFRINPNWDMSAFHARAHMDLKVDLKLHALYRARKIALRKINGSIEEQYAKLWDYREELLRKNPDSTVEIELESSTNSVFKRIYICFGSLKKGFREGCRPVIGFDGCHIKGPHSGQLLSAVGVDANNCMYTFAYAIVEAESKDTWLWFLENIFEDLQLSTGHGWTFISDRQKGLQYAIELLAPYAEVRVCVRHLYNNFKAMHSGKTLKDYMWACVRAMYPQQFTVAMQKVMDEDEGAYGWLAKQPAATWSRSHFSAESKCDILLNNMCEAFNKTILFARDKPILAMLEMIRDFLMKRLQMKYETMSKYSGKFTPKVLKYLEKMKILAAEVIPKYAGNNQFEASHISGLRYAVDLNKSTCGCRRWDLTRIPCSHVVACMQYMQSKPETYVNPFYSKDAYLKAYNGIISPLNGQEMWAKTNLPPIKPPRFHKQTGRPKKKRNLEIGEIPKVGDNVTNLSKKFQVTVKCSQCGKLGHNKKTCHRKNNPGGGTKMEDDVPLETLFGNLRKGLKRRFVDGGNGKHVNDHSEIPVDVNDHSEIPVDVNDHSEIRVDKNSEPHNDIRVEIPVEMPVQLEKKEHDKRHKKLLLPIRQSPRRIMRTKWKNTEDTPILVDDGDVEETENGVASKNSGPLKKKVAGKSKLAEDAEKSILTRSSWNGNFTKSSQPLDFCPMIHKEQVPFVEQHTIKVGGIKVTSASFQSKGNKVVTMSSLNEAVKHAKEGTRSRKGKAKVMG